MADNEPDKGDVPPPQLDQSAFKDAQFAPKKRGSAQMTNQSKGDK